MTELEIIKYLLTKYAGYSAKANDAKKRKDDFDYAYYNAKEDFALTVLQECFGMNVCETGDGYVAYGGGKSVEVKKIKSNYKN